jgi:excisionase family DNA binding protein
MEDQQNQANPQPLLLTIKDVARMLNIGRNQVYKLIYYEHLPIQKFGRSTRVSRVALLRWLEQRGTQKHVEGEVLSWRGEDMEKDPSISARTGGGPPV